MTETRTPYQTLQATLPADLDRAILRCLRFRQGRDNAMSRTELVQAVKAQGCEAHERQVREAVHDLRRNGQLICSAPGENGGYWMAVNWEELLNFVGSELHSKAIDMLETEKALKAEAEKRWGKSQQEKLF